METKVRQDQRVQQVVLKEVKVTDTGTLPATQVFPLSSLFKI